MPYRGEEKRGEENRGSEASPGDGAGAPSVADQADRLLDEYERTILPTLQRIGDGTFTVELDGPSDYVTFTLDAMRDDPEAQRVLPLADSNHPLSHDGEALFRSFAIVRGRRAMPVRKLAFRTLALPFSGRYGASCSAWRRFCGRATGR